MARFSVVLAIAVAACGVSGPSVTASSLGLVAPSPLAVEFLDDSEVTPDEIELADAAERCAAAQGVEVEAQSQSDLRAG